MPAETIFKTDPPHFNFVHSVELRDNRAGEVFRPGAYESYATI